MKPITAQVPLTSEQEKLLSEDGVKEWIAREIHAGFWEAFYKWIDDEAEVIMNGDGTEPPKGILRAERVMGKE